MKRLTREWVEKAEGDLASARRELRARKNLNYDDACFHAQQCAEKYMKALLQEQETPFARTHNLLALLKMLLPAHPSWDELRGRLDALTDYAVNLRYPGDSADKAAAGDAFETAKEVRRRARLLLKLPP